MRRLNDFRNVRMHYVQSRGHNNNCSLLRIFEIIESLWDSEAILVLVRGFASSRLARYLKAVNKLVIEGNRSYFLLYT